MTDPDARRAAALDLYHRGQIREAIQAQLAVINGLGEGAGLEDYNRFALFLYALGDYRAMVGVLDFVLGRWPGDPGTLVNLGVAHLRCNDFAAARRHFEQALPARPDDANLRDGLARACAVLGDWDACQAHGERALILKDRAAGEAPPPALPPAPPFRADQPERNVIAFSLWGDSRRYLDGAVANARLAAHVFPEWRCRFYHDGSVPAPVLNELARQQARLVRVEDSAPRLHAGLFWRFAAAFDPDIDRFLIRDTDSLIGGRERDTVGEWLRSGRHFHVVRDNPSHTDLILAGLWGGVAGLLPDLTAEREAMLTDRHRTNHCDQDFLNRHVWPLIRGSVLIHDRHYRCFGAVPPPPAAGPHPDAHIGQDATVWPTAFHPAKWTPV